MRTWRNLAELLSSASSDTSTAVYTWIAFATASLQLKLTVAIDPQWISLLTLCKWGADNDKKNAEIPATCFVKVCKAGYYSYCNFFSNICLQPLFVAFLRRRETRTDLCKTQWSFLFNMLPCFTTKHLCFLICPWLTFGILSFTHLRSCSQLSG